MSEPGLLALTMIVKNEARTLARMPGSARA
jgi:hypothetical protein